MKASKIAFEKPYCDNSGVEYGVRLNRDEIEFEAIQIATFPIHHIDWILEAVKRIKEEIDKPNAKDDEPQK